MKKDYFGQASPATALHRSVFILQQKADELLSSQIGVGLSQFRIMSQLHANIPRSQRTVATMLHQTEANVSRQLQVMKKAGLVSIVRNKNDRRVREVTLTTIGVKLHDKGDDLLNKHYKSASEVTHLAEKLRILA